MTGNGTVNGSSNLEIAQSNQDLIMTKGKRKKRNWILAGVATIVLLALIVAAIVLLSNEKKGSKRHSKLQADEDGLSLDDVILGRLNAKSFNATWISGNELMYTDESRNLVKYNVANRSKTVLLPSSDELMLSAFDFKLSADGLYLLVAHESQKIYRHSFLSKYTIVDLQTGGRNHLSTQSGPYLQLVVWSPTGNALAYVAKNSLYYKKSPHDGSAVQVAAGAEFLYNGVPDWVYEEEVFSSNTALWFSPDGRQLAYATFNDTRVPLMVLPIYGEPGNPAFQYPRAQVIKYPKAGAPNPDVTLTVVDLSKPDILQVLEPPKDLLQREPILSTVVWSDNGTLCAIWMNRIQNEAQIIAYKTATASASLVKHLKQNGGWLELFTAPHISPNGQQMGIVLSQDQGKNLGAYRHLKLLPINGSAEGKDKEQVLTKGAFVVTEILGWDHAKDVIYYLANTAQDSAVSHLYSLEPKTDTIKCLSCTILTQNNSKCTYNTAAFSTNYDYYVLSCSGPEIPEIYVYNTTTNKLVQNWELNEELKAVLKGKKLPVTKKLDFTIAGNFTAKVILKLPPDLDTSGTTKYPMLINVYGGPDSYQVIDKFNLDWGSYLATSKGIIYALIDGRGSGLRGDLNLFAGYRNLGTVEVQDQLNVTKLLQDSLPYIDSSRTAIWGWSYGGYASGMALAEDKDGVFKCGISVAPVTDWTLYDSIYTERFMGLPSPADNADGYRKSLLLRKYEGLRNKMYFLIHGTFDDNVHYQQSMLWSRILELRDVMFRQLSYPDEDHSLATVRPHLYHSLEGFLDDCFVDKDEE